MKRISGHTAYQQTQYDRPHTQETVRRTVEEDDAHQYQQCQPQVLQRTESTAIDHRLTATAGSDTGLDQAHTDERDNDTRYQRRNDLPGVRQQTTHHHLDDRCHHAGTENVAEPQADIHLAADHAEQTCTDDRTDERERRSLDAEQPRPDRTEPAALDESGQPRHEKRHRDEEAGGLQIELQRRADDERRRDDSDEDGQQMLQGGKQRLTERRTVVQTIDEFLGLFHSFTF